MNKTLGNNIRKIRMLKDIDTEQIADALAISVSAYSKIERGETQIDFERICKIAKELGVLPSIITEFSADVFFQKPQQVELTSNPSAPNNHFNASNDVLNMLNEQLKRTNILVEQQQKLIEALLAKGKSKKDEA